MEGRLKLTPKQKKFADKYLELDNGTQAALQTYNTTDPNTAHVIASENLRKPTVMQYLEGYAERAAVRIRELSEQEEHLPTALSASKDILDRTGYGAIDKSISVSVDGKQAADIMRETIIRFRANN